MTTSVRPQPAQAASASRPAKGPTAPLPFKADLDLTELDDRRRASLTWPARGISLSRSQLVFRSRRMCYAGRSLCVAVHLVDDKPVPLFGEVVTSEYDGDGLYRTTLSLLPIPDEDPIRDWIASVGSHNHSHSHSH